MNSSVAATVLAPAILGLPQPSTQTLMIAAGVVLLLFAIGAFVTSRPPVKAKIDAGYDRAFGWIDRAITAWHADGRLTDTEAARLRTELREPDFTAVLPHFGVHLTIGVFLRFPFGSIVRASYVAANMALTHLRLVTRRIDRHTFRRLMGIHSPIVLVLTCFPGIGTFAYLASKPFRAHHLLARVALDAVLLKLPKQVYERSGLRMAVARTADAHGGDAEQREPRLRFHIVPAQIMVLLTVVAGGLFAADIVMQTLDAIYAPTFQGWQQVSRILDLGSESSLGTWFAVVMLLLCAVVLALIAYAKHQVGDRFARHWTVLALLAFAFSLDEQAKFHDAGGGAQVRESLGLGGVLYYGWVVIALISVVAVAFIYRRFIVHLPAGIRNALIVAAGFYVGGEVLVEMVNGWLMDSQGDTYLYKTTTSVEELFGMIGVLVAFGALLVYSRTAVGSVGFRVVGADQQVVTPPAVVDHAVRPDSGHRAPTPIGVGAME